MKVSLKDVKIGEKIKVELKPLETQNPDLSGDDLKIFSEILTNKYEGELVDVQDNLFALKNGETILIFDTDLYEIFDETKKGAIVINLSFE